MKTRNLLTLVAVAAMVGLAAQSAHAQALSNNLFSQYETTQGASTTTAGMYPAPHYVPPHVGSTYYTYQPLQPHEMMYTHARKYYNPYAGPESFYADQCGNGRCGAGGGSGFNVTTVVWQNGCQHMGPLPCSIQPFAGLMDAMARHRYCHRPGGHGLGGHHGRHGHRLFGRHHGACADGSCGTGDCGNGYYGTPAGTETYTEEGGASAQLTDEQDSAN